MSSGWQATSRCSNFCARDNFSKRYENGDAIWLHEFFYALMQGYDAVAQETDVQIGGTDQLFNLMAGRKLMESMGMRPQTVLTSRILVGTDGEQRMSKSTGNSIGIDEPPGVIFTKVLNLPDGAIRNYAELVTRWSPTEIEERLGRSRRQANWTCASSSSDLRPRSSPFSTEKRRQRAGGRRRSQHAPGPRAQRCAHLPAGRQKPTSSTC